MVDKPIDPKYIPPHTPPAAQGPEKTPKPFSHEGKQWTAKPMTWLGMHFNSDEAQKLWKVIIQNISSAIGKDKEKALKALKKLRADSQDDE